MKSRCPLVFVALLSAATAARAQAPAAAGACQQGHARYLRAFAHASSRLALPFDAAERRLFVDGLGGRIKAVTGRDAELGPLVSAAPVDLQRWTALCQEKAALGRPEPSRETEEALLRDLLLYSAGLEDARRLKGASVSAAAEPPPPTESWPDQIAGKIVAAIRGRAGALTTEKIGVEDGDDVMAVKDSGGNARVTLRVDPAGTMKWVKWNECSDFRYRVLTVFQRQGGVGTAKYIRVKDGDPNILLAEITGHVVCFDFLTGYIRGRQRSDGSCP